MVGPYDLSASMGYPGQYDRPDVQKALQKVNLICKKLNKCLGFHVIESSYLNVLEKIDLGYSLLAFSLDFFFLGDKAKRKK